MKYSTVVSLLVAAVTAQSTTNVQNQSGTATPGETPSPYITPSAHAPSGYKSSTSGYFGIQIVNVTSTGSASAAAATGLKKRMNLFGRQVSQIADGQIQAATTTTKASVTPVAQISDGQLQAQTTAAAVVTPVQQISDGQIQAHTTGVQIMYVTVTTTVTKNNCVATPITQIADGQIQAPMATPVMQISDGQIQAVTTTAAAATPVQQISDGQIQAKTTTAAAGTPVAQISDGQIQAKTTTAAAGTPVAQISDGQLQATSAAAAPQLSDGQIQAATTTSSAMTMATMTGQPQTCYRSGVLATSLNNGILVDSEGRYGEIVANYQFQFDLQPQAGAIATGGWSIAPNGTLTLGDSSIFYQCLSGTFYNIYSESIGAQCVPVYIETIQLNNDC